MRGGGGSSNIRARIGRPASALIGTLRQGRGFDRAVVDVYGRPSALVGTKTLEAPVVGPAGDLARRVLDPRVPDVRAGLVAASAGTRRDSRGCSRGSSGSGAQGAVAGIPGDAAGTPCLSAARAGDVATAGSPGSRASGVRGRVAPRCARRYHRRMQRVVGGELGGRRLMSLPGNVRGVRPTSSKLRGAIFDRLQGEIVGARFLDPFAGSGAVSIEALSRGASSATLVERQRALVQFLGRQLAALGSAGARPCGPGTPRGCCDREGHRTRSSFSTRLTRTAPSMAGWRGSSWTGNGSRPAR